MQNNLENQTRRIRKEVIQDVALEGKVRELIKIVAGQENDIKLLAKSVDYLTKIVTILAKDA